MTTSILQTLLNPKTDQVAISSVIRNINYIHTKWYSVLSLRLARVHTKVMAQVRFLCFDAQHCTNSVQCSQSYCSQQPTDTAPLIDLGTHTSFWPAVASTAVHRILRTTMRCAQQNVQLTSQVVAPTLFVKTYCHNKLPACKKLAHTRSLLHAASTTTAHRVHKWESIKKKGTYNNSLRNHLVSMGVNLFS